MKPQNLIILMADELSTKSVGCYGNRQVKTPNIDALAARGTRFTNAYTNSPVCMAARACFATGLYPHQSGYWDNSLAYDGKETSWGHRLQQNGHRFTTIGKLHYGADLPTGIDEQIIPMHALGGGDVYGLLREEQPHRPQSSQLAEKMGPGDGDYIRYDRKITELSIEWLEKQTTHNDKPWVLFISYLSPHFPLIVPQKYIDLYPLDEISLPKTLSAEGHSGHPWWETFAKGYDFDRYFKDDEHRLRAIQAYLGLCTFVDENIGQVLNTLKSKGLDEHTCVVMTADHGDNLGARGMWNKCLLYRESTGVPLIVAGPGVPAGRDCSTNTNLVDLAPTILHATGATPLTRAPPLPGRSLLDLAAAPNDPDRLGFSEYHAVGAISSAFMIARGRYKYHYYVGYAPELFDLDADPQEVHDLYGDARYATVLQEFEATLRGMLNPEAVDRKAKDDQNALVARAGGRDRALFTGPKGATPAPGA